MCPLVSMFMPRIAGYLGCVPNPVSSTSNSSLIIIYSPWCMYLCHEWNVRMSETNWSLSSRGVNYHCMKKLFLLLTIDASIFTSKRFRYILIPVCWKMNINKISRGSEFYPGILNWEIIALSTFVVDHLGKGLPYPLDMQHNCEIRTT